MCWLGKLENKHVAKEDIRVFKVCKLAFNKDIVPYFKPYQDIKTYREGETYYDSIGIEYSSQCSGLAEITQGLHSYTIGNYEGSESLEACSTFICDGFTVIESNREYNNNGARIVLCTIPKGSIYYLNRRGEIVSNCLRVDKILNTRVTYDNIRDINNQMISFKILGH